MSVSPEMMSQMQAGQGEIKEDDATLPERQAAYGPGTHEEIMAQFNSRLKQSERHSLDWRQEAADLYDMEAGHQWADADKSKMEQTNRPMVTFNLMQKFLDAVVGLQINNRQQIQCYPRKAGKVQVSELGTGAIAWNRDKSHVDIEESDAGHDLLLTGMGWMEHFYDDEGPTQGHIGGERRDPLEMYWDPGAKRKNLIDRKWQIRVRKVHPDEYRDLFGEDPAGSLDVPGVNAYDGGKVEVIMKPQDYDTSTSGFGAADKGKVVIADYQWCAKHHYVEVLAKFPTGEGLERFSMEEWKEIEPKLKAAGIPYEERRSKKKAYYRAWITSSGIHGKVKELPYGFTFQALTGKRDRNSNTWFGLGRGICDPQRWVNKFFSSILWQLSVNPKGGVLLEEGAVEDEQEFEDSWADPSRPSYVTKGALVAGKVQPKPPGHYPEGMDRLMTFSVDALPQVSGINAELLGMTNRDQAGVVEYQRKQGALAIVAWFFDALRRYYQEAGELMLPMIRDLIADGRLILIAGEEGAQYVPLLKEPLSQEFDLIVDEAPTSVNMQEKMWAVLQQIVPLALQMGMKVPLEVLDYVPLPAALTEKWKAEMKPSPQQIQQSEMQNQIRTRQETAKAAKDETAAQLNSAKAQDITQKTPVELEAEQMGTLKTAAEVGKIQAGG